MFAHRVCVSGPQSYLCNAPLPVFVAEPRSVTWELQLENISYKQSDMLNGFLNPLAGLTLPALSLFSIGNSAATSAVREF